MSVAFAMAAPTSHVSPPCQNLHRLPFSPLNRTTANCHPATGIKAGGATAVQTGNDEPATSISTATHLSNLERLLEKQQQQKQSPPPPSAPELRSAAKDDSGLDDSHFSLLQKTGSRLLNALNLPSAIFLRRFSNKLTEEMSPGSLNMLHRLLSNSNRASPRGSIARNWRRFHGADDWEGLLDPLNDDLRRELVRYGEFVQATYHAFHSGGAQPDRPRQVVLPDRNYRVTRNLFTTASVELPPWVDTVAPWMMAAQPTSWIGYVAVCENEREIQRMGRRDIVIALRGTSTCLEWAENFRTELVPIDDEDLFAVEDDNEEEEEQSGVPKVECGFRSLYKTPGWETPSLSTAVVEEVRKLTEEYAGEELSITVVGHSLGAALAVLVADELAACVPAGVATAAITFGGPRAGNRAFADRVEARGAKVLRVVNAHDLVTRVPGLRSHADGYAHVGQELVVDSRNSPYLRPGADPACCHDLEAYLHLVDGFSGSNCPFRADAKRSLARLLSQQGANMKKVYVSRARELQRQAAGSFGRCNSDQLASPTTTY